MRPSPTDVRWIFDKLRELDILTYHSEDELIELVQSMSKARLASGKVVIRQGQIGKAFYLIQNGKVDVWAETPEGRKLLATLEGGDSFGEASILTGEVCNATVTARGDVDLFSLPPSGVRKVVQSNPVLAEKMAEAVGRRKGARALGLEPVPLSSRSLLARVRSFLLG